MCRKYPESCTLKCFLRCRAWQGSAEQTGRCVECTIGKRLPLAATTIGDQRGVERKFIQSLLRRAQAGTGREHATPELGLSFIDPQHRGVCRSIKVW
jgi:hypothetical protein